MCDAKHVFEVALYQESDLINEKHYTDTAGFVDHMFGLLTCS
ncbi:transposase [Burkholderia cenocepacia]|nr:transposase [Burkholderia cenocepacia]